MKRLDNNVMHGKCKVILDTNLWISFLLTKNFDFLDNLLGKGNIRLVFSDELLSELIEVANRPKLKKFFTDEDWNYVSNLIEEFAVYYSVVSQVNICRDTKDNFLLSLAKDSCTDYLLTGDNDLLILKSFETTKIITIAEFKTQQGLA
ncbi:MAG: putative toxin-antitoxin system toxin component, PIN family [Dysgonamonadaceae bacterium]|nr:putative toxin-antitoxin system toxin component, PIN family [Dysgonamonadaceae bacterium]